MAAYRGETWAKKMARYLAWGAILGPMGDGPVERARFMVLCGPEAADARLLMAFGVNPENIIAVDSDRDAIASARQRVPGPRYIVGDALKIARQHRRKIDVVMLDFCKNLSVGLIDYWAQCVAIGAKEEGARVGLAASYGRERGRLGALKSSARQRVASEPIYNINPAHESRSDAGPEAHPLAAQMMFFQEQSYRSFDRRAVLFANAALANTFAYKSVGSDGGGSPMVYFVGAVERRATVGHGAFNPISMRVPSAPLDATHLVKTNATMLAGSHGSRFAADVFNVSAGRVAAWLAVDTARGNRGEGSVAADFREFMSEMSGADRQRQMAAGHARALNGE